ncbi:MAG: sulfoxide reductase heme-binding subunit YedZ [Chromatiaceae bacterium]|nr:sulfoxide reductase heme-binding subunit YedZ [Gammaproteobacteria bacterium]MCP5318216.1 sulfoxide reductase heme-binding subunit YedZ [Chromatiaceae bacterium]MCP5435041.1 sulfoxide reductase heme-binding subunit YedZ [Chromatiaceae bacterium]MCW5584979.1 sulfoxide reductase heme-binding subunit YedZ [Chromatiales bacterium]HPQ24315.1 protein-methionine-sulfoxide reductase heme-binding subunit MsrQ [Gammaproteobacteria bacterium]
MQPIHTSDRWLRFVAKPMLFMACLVPFALLVQGVLDGDLGANPLERVTDVTGQWGLRFLLLTLAVTPLRRLTGWNRLLRFRRMLGLFVFFYISLHFLTWVWLDQELNWGNITADIAKRPFVTVGFTAWLLLLSLAATSTRGMMRRLGRNWQRLHRAVYAVGVLGVLHYIWLVKADLLQPLIYTGVLALLLLVRWRPRLFHGALSLGRPINVR